MSKKGSDDTIKIFLRIKPSPKQSRNYNIEKTFDHDIVRFHMVRLRGQGLLGPMRMGMDRGRGRRVQDAPTLPVHRCVSGQVRQSAKESVDRQYTPSPAVGLVQAVPSPLSP